MTGRLTVLILGGYGAFGGRIVTLLEAEPRFTLAVAGRSLVKAQAFCRARGATAARLIPTVADRNGDLTAVLADLLPDIVVDASGPFQAYGERPYRVIEACLARRIDYLDLADGSDFVAGVMAFDEQAKAAGVFVLSGVSSFPVLTAAVVRHLAAPMTRVTSIWGGLAPTPFAGVGENVIRAIAGYAGQPVALRRNGKTGTGYPLTETRRATIAPPGHLPLRNILFSLVDVPDLRALATLWPEADDIWIGAGPIPEILHRALIGLAWLVRLRLVRSLSPLATWMYRADRLLGWGEHRGGLLVEVRGRDAADRPLARSWHMVAEGDDGPPIPAMAVATLVRRALDGRRPAPGARAALRELELADYEALFAGRRIHSGERDDMTSAAPLYRRLLGTAMDDLPPAIAALHETASASGFAEIERGTTLLARVAGAIMRFPAAGNEVPVTVRFVRRGDHETWTRTFGGRAFSSQQYPGTRRWDRLVCEQFGPLRFAMALVVEEGRLTLVLRHWRAFGVPLPMALCPTSTAHETAQNGRFRFDVEIGHRLIGRIVRYRGWLVPDADSILS